MPARNIRPWLWIAAAIVLLDQASKWVVLGVMRPGEVRYVTPFWNWVLTFNPGAAFSFLAGTGGWQRWFFLAIALGASAWLAWLLAKPVRSLEGLAYSLILGGALGNAFDRAVRGSVIDYLDFHLHGWHWPAFNIADMAIVGGAVGLIASSVLGHREANTSSRRHT